MEMGCLQANGNDARPPGASCLVLGSSMACEPVVKRRLCCHIPQHLATHCRGRDPGLYSTHRCTVSARAARGAGPAAAVVSLYQKCI